MTARERLVRGYVNLVRSDRITLEDVPEKYRQEVEEALSK